MTTSNPSDNDALPTLDTVRFQRLRNLSAFGAIIAEFEFSTPMLLTRMEWAAAQHDIEELRLAVTRLQGSSASIGGLRLSNLCMRLKMTLESSIPATITTDLVGVRDEYDILVAAFGRVL